MGFSKKRRGQVSTEYLIIAGFLAFVIIVVLGVALFYSAGIKDRIRVYQLESFANKIVSTSESLFYSGEPSQATVKVYLPQGVESIEFIENSIIISMQTSSGLEKRAFSSNVPISGDIPASWGTKKILVKVFQQHVVVSEV